MANRRQPSLITCSLWPGSIAVMLIISLVLISVSGLLFGLQPTSDPLNWRYLWHILLFTLLQAGLSTLCAVLPAIPLAVIAYRQRVISQRWLIDGCQLLMTMPSLVAISAIISLYGQQGYLHQLLVHLGLSYRFPLYGLTGILLAHSLFNVPLAFRHFLQTLNNLHSEQYRLANQLGLDSYAQWRHLYWPLLKAQILPISSLIFMLCFASFAVVLTLGGGPRATTLTVAIYQSLNYDYNLPQAAQLAVLQLFSSMCLLCFIRPSSPLLSPAQPNSITQWRSAPVNRSLKHLSYLLVLLAALFFALPFVAVISQGLTPALLTVLQQATFWQASWTSLRIALASAALCLLLACLLLWSSRQLWLTGRYFYQQSLQNIGYIVLALPPLVLSCGLLLFFHQLDYLPQRLDGLFIMTNALLSLPYALTLLASPMQQQAKQYQPLCQLLNIGGWYRWWYIDFPLLFRLFWQTFAMSCLLSLGDFSIVALFGSQQFITLPFYLYQQLGAYRADQASATALLLLVFCYLLLISIEGISRLLAPAWLKTVHYDHP